jgi:dTDP-4-dehydrorhamnose reductase
MKILVTGASGYVGASIFTNLSKHYELIGTFQKNKLFDKLIELDITNKEAVVQAFLTIRPELTIHAAAIPSKKVCEKYPKSAIAVNFEGTKNVVTAANMINSKVVYVSTLGVNQNPPTLYGKTKLMGERYIQKVRTGYNILRLSMTFGYSPNLSNDRPFNRIIKTLRTGQPNSYDSSWRFAPTYLRDVSQTIQMLVEEKVRNKILTVAIPELKSTFEIASDILKPFGRTVKPENTNRDKFGELPELNDIPLPISSYHTMIRAITRDIQKNNILNLPIS